MARGLAHPFDVDAEPTTRGRGPVLSGMLKLGLIVAALGLAAASFLLALYEIGFVRLSLAPAEHARVDLTHIMRQADNYCIENEGLYPPTLADLYAWAGPRGVTLPATDPWGGAYVYRIDPDRKSYRVIGRGPDGVPDTPDDPTFP